MTYLGSSLFLEGSQALGRLPGPEQHLQEVDIAMNKPVRP